MKNADIVSLVNGGIQNITALTLPSSQAYKVYKFKRAIEAAYNAIVDAQKDILKQAGIENLQEFQKRYKELSDIKERTSEEQAELDSLVKKDEDAGKLVQELYRDTTNLDVKAMPYEDWHNLQAENKDIKILTHLEHTLEGVLWLAPEE